MNDEFYRLIKWIIWFLGACAIVLFMIGITQAETFQELSVPYGFGFDHYTGMKVEYTYGKILNKHWEVGMKSHVGSLMYEDERFSGWQIGIGPIIRYVYPAGDNRTFLFVDTRVAIGYAQAPDNHLIENGITCFAEGNIGIRTAITDRMDGILGFNFSHISSSRPADSGINLYGPVVGIRW